MNGSYEDKFPQAKAMYLYMYIHPGKKLNFMGGEFGQLRERDEKREQDWDILKYPKHDSFFRFMKQLNKLYLTHSALYERDYDRSGFGWIDCGNIQNCIYAIERKSENETVIGIFNFSDSKKSYSVHGYEESKILINTDWNEFGRNTPHNSRIDLNDITLPAFSAIMVQVNINEDSIGIKMSYPI